jgi:hypothetical protein
VIQSKNIIFKNVSTQTSLQNSDRSIINGFDESDEHAASEVGDGFAFLLHQLLHS